MEGTWLISQPRNGPQKPLQIANPPLETFNTKSLHIYLFLSLEALLEETELSATEAEAETLAL